MQQLGEKVLPQYSQAIGTQQSIDAAWFKLEKLLRDYTQYHFDRKIRSASLIDIGDLKF